MNVDFLTETIHDCTEIAEIGDSERWKGKIVTLSTPGIRPL